MEFRPYYLAREWVAAGHKVQIIAGSYSHIRAQQPAMGKTGITQEVIDGISYQWYPTPIYNGNGIARVKSMLSFITQLWRNGSHIVASFKPDVVISSSTYPMDIWPATKIARLANAKLVFEVHDLWPLSPMELGGMSRWHPFILLVQLAEDYAYRHADRVVSMLPKTKEYMIGRGMAPEKWAYVPNGIDLSEWQSPAPLPREAQEAIKRIRRLDVPIVCYAGTHGLANALDILLDAAALLHKNAQILLVGTGPERDRLEQRVIAENIDNVTFLAPVPKQSIPELLSRIDIAYIGWHPNPLYRFGISPNKLMDYMTSGSPIIHAVKAGNDPVADAGCGLTVAPGDPHAVAQAVLQLANLSTEERSAMGRAGKDYILKNQTYQILSKNFLDLV